MKKRVSFALVLSMLVSMLTFCNVMAFAAADPLTYEYDDSTMTATVTECDESATTVSIPKTVTKSGKKYTVTAIGYQAFYWMKSLKSVTIPDSVEIIGPEAFMNSSLASVNIPDSVTIIDDRAFFGCSSLTSIAIPDSVEIIGRQAFAFSSFANVNIPASVTYMADSAFDGDLLSNITVDANNKFYSSQQGVLFNKDKTELISYPSGKTETSYNIPASVKIIRAGAFGGCTSLTKVTIPDSVITIGGFGGCSSLKSITIPNSVTTIGVSAFFGCSSLTSIAIPNSVTTIEKYAFTECTSLKSISVPKSVKYIGERAFFICNSLSDVYYEGSKSDRGLISVLPNEYGYISYKFVNATWHYNTYPEPEVIIKDTSKIFNDIPKSAWYKQYIDYAYTYGIFGGKSANTFEPDANITRAEFVQVLANISGVNTANKNVRTKFADVRSGQWYAPAVKWASDNGIVAGKSATSFDPNAKISREEMCVMLVNYANFKGIKLKRVETKTMFSDDRIISSWAKERVYMCQMADIVNGKGENKFDPQGTAIRAEAATIFKLFHEQYLR